MELSFNLPSEFVQQYRGLPEPFGFNGLGSVTFYRTYSRKRNDGTYESWVDVCERVINGMYSIQKDHCGRNFCPWSEEKAIESAQEAFDRMFHLKWSPSGRGMWLLGTPFIHERKVSEALLNCAFVTTENIYDEGGKIFSWFMEMLMLGVGVGADTKGAGEVVVRIPHGATKTFKVPDTREGWAESVKHLVNSYLDSGSETNDYQILFDYSLVRAKGEPIKGFGGVSSGPEPLIKLHERIREYLDRNDNGAITSRTIVDIFNAIGACVIAGNVRRSAEIMFGEANDNEFINLKDYDRYPDRAEIGWSSNNSIFATVGQKYFDYAELILKNGEPGFAWMENVRKFGRMGEEKPDNAAGFNPCGEQPLASKEMCLLTEIYMNRHTDLYDYLRTVKFAYLYAKTISLTYGWITDYESRNIMVKNRRIGLSNTGITQFVYGGNGLDKAIEWMDRAYSYVQHYDEHYSQWLGVNKSIRTTTVKPSGTASLLAGSTPGIHFPIAPYYIRRVRLQEDTDLVNVLRNAGFHVEPDVYSDNTVVVEFPISAGGNIPSEKDVSIWEQLELTAVAQKHWSDNSVSVTVKVIPGRDTKEDIERALSFYQYRLKSVSLLPEPEGGAYVQMPYEAITKEQYDAMIERIDFEPLNNLRDAITYGTKLYDMYCDGGACSLENRPQ